MKLNVFLKYVLFVIISFILKVYSTQQSSIQILLNLFSSQEIKIDENRNLDSFFASKQNHNIDIILNAEKVSNHHQEKKKWTVLIYIAGVNDLFKYAIRNIKQMMEVGSNKELNIIIHFDFHIRGMKKMTKRFYIERDKLKQIGEISALDSGDSKNLINAAQWAHHSYPSENFALILWNHGTGSCDPLFMRKLANPKDFFFYNPHTKKIALNRNRDFLEYISNADIPNDEETKGICFDDTTRNYLDNKKLTYALAKILEIKNKKINVILLDACLMGGIEIADLCSPYAEYLVVSEEVVLGPGYNYALTLKSLLKENCTPYEFAIQTVKNYAQTYAPLSHDFTQSAIKLDILEEFKIEFKYFIELLINLLNNENKEHIKKIIKLSASREMVTHFSEPSYIDLKHFLENILLLISENPKKLLFNKKEIDVIKNIKFIINKKLIPLLNKVIIANITGDNIPKASGLYIYFPKYNIEDGYKNTNFPLSTKWLQLLEIIKKNT